MALSLSDLVVEVRDKNLNRLGTIRAEDLDLELMVEHCGPGSWTVTLPSEHPLTSSLNSEGSGIVVSGPYGVILSGPTTGIEGAVTPDDLGGTLTFSGVSDNITLWDYRAWPDPSNPDATTQAVSHDERAGAVTTLMHAYVNYNCGPLGTSARKRSVLTMGADPAAGGTITYKARFNLLAELVTELGAPAGYGWHIRQSGSTTRFDVYQVQDRTKTIYLDTRMGTLSGYKASVSPPGATHVIVAGQGELEERQFTYYSTTESVAAADLWARRIEAFVDQRQTDDPTEHLKKAQEVLSEQGRTTVSMQAVPPDDSVHDFGKEWFLGDKISVVMGDTVSVGTAVGFIIKADADNGMRAGMVLGDATAFSSSGATAKAVDSLESRVSTLEREIGQRPPSENIPWTNYTPALSTSSGALFAASSVGRYTVVEKVCHWRVTIQVTDAGTAANATLRFGLPKPVTANGGAGEIFVGRENQSTGSMLQAVAGPGVTNATILRYDNTSPLVSNRTFMFSGSYEVA